MSDDDIDAMFNRPSYVFQNLYVGQNYTAEMMRNGEYIPLSLILDLSDGIIYSYIEKVDKDVIAQLANGILKEEYIQEVLRRIKRADVWYLMNWKYTSEFLSTVIRDMERDPREIAKFFNTKVIPEIYRFWTTTSLHYNLVLLEKSHHPNAQLLMQYINYGRPAFARRTIKDIKKSLANYYDGIDHWFGQDVISHMKSE